VQMRDDILDGPRLELGGEQQVGFGSIAEQGMQCVAFRQKVHGLGMVECDHGGPSSCRVPTSERARPRSSMEKHGAGAKRGWKASRHSDLEG
jgi:hypothetical protein